MTDADRIKKLQERALDAEDLAERQKKMIAWLAGRLAKALGPASWEDGDLVCYDMPEESRDQLCHRGAEGCAECWADLAEGEVNGLEYYLKPEYQGRGLFEETAQEFLERKRREARAGKAQDRIATDEPVQKARVLQFKPSAGARRENPNG